MREQTDLLETSVRIIKENQSRYGSYVAAPNYPTYHYCWLRDGTFTACSMDVAGEHDSARRYYHWVHETINRHAWKVESLLSKGNRGERSTPDDYLHARYRLDGTEASEAWNNKQFDGYATWLWGLAEHIKMTGEEYLLEEFGKSIEVTLKYLTHVWKEPCYDCWEEFPDKVHTSTLACIAGGLSAINVFLKDRGIERQAREIIDFLKSKCTFERRFAKFYDPAADRSRGIDGSLLWIAYPFNIVSPTDPLFSRTCQEIEARLLNGGVHRYPGDTFYGGGEWIILTLWLAWHYHTMGRVDRYDSLVEWVEGAADERGQLPEQVSVRLNTPEEYQKWVDRWGPVAKPLLWSHAMYILVKEI